MSYNPLEKIHPIFPSAETQSLKDDEKEKDKECYHVKKESEQPPRTLPPASCLPANLTRLYGDSQVMLTLLDLFGVASKTCSLLGSEAASHIPILNLFSAPIYLYHAATKAHTRFGIMVDAIKVGRYADAFFWGGRGVDSVGTAVGNISKTLSGVGTLAGLSAFTVFGLIFTFILPLTVTICGVVGGVACTWALWRNSHTLETMKNKNLEPLASTLEYLQGPKGIVEKEDEATDKTAQLRFHTIEKHNFITTHFTSSTRFEEVQNRLDSLRKKLTLQKESVHENAELREVFKGFKHLERVFDRLLHSQEGQEWRLLGDLHSLYTLILEMPSLRGELRKKVEENLKALYVLEGDAQNTIQMSQEECQRNVYYHALFLFIALIMISQGMLTLIAPQHAAIGAYLGIAGCTIEIGQILFDKGFSWNIPNSREDASA